MSETSDQIRLSKAAKEFNVGIGTLVEEAARKGFKVDSNPNTKISKEIYDVLSKEFAKDKSVKEESKALGLSRARRDTVSIEEKTAEAPKPAPAREENEILIKETALHPVAKEEKKKAPKEPEAEVEQTVTPAPLAAVEPVEEVVETKPRVTEIGEIKVVGKIDLGESKKSKSKSAKEKAPEPPAEPLTSKKGKKGKKSEEPVAEKAPVEEVKPVVIQETPSVKEETPEVAPENKEPEVHVTKYEKLGGPTILGKIELPVKEEKKPVKPNAADDAGKKKRKRIRKGALSASDYVEAPKKTETPGQTAGPRPQQAPHQRDKRRDFKREKEAAPKQELTQEEIDAQIKETLARLSGAGKSAASKYRRQKRDMVSEKMMESMEQQEAERKVLKVTEFVSANELASMMNVPVNNIISTCMSLGMFVSINQRLSAEIINIVAEEFGYKVEFVSAEDTVTVEEETDAPETLETRAPIVTVMGHVDHGKTSLLDYVRKANVIAGEAGGITQHIGAYNVTLENGRHIAFIDTPGHEAFTAMRARGAQVTDIVIVVVAADDSVMPQTREAINHAQAAGVPIVFAINKIDKPGANPDRIREELAAMNILVEEWGGKYQCQEVSAKKGTNIDLLLEKVLLEADLLNLKANPNRNALGTVIESSLDKGRGYVSTILVQNGTLKIGDIVLAGCYSGRVKALNNERGSNIKKAGPSTPALLLGLSGAPQAGDKFKVMDDEREAREIASKRLQLQREQGYRTQKHITLDEIGRRLAIGDFKELNIIVKGDVDGSVEALTDSLLKLSTEKIQVKVIHKSVGQVTESDVLLASASDAIIVAFQVRPSSSARKLAEQEQIDLRTYSIIYDAINEVKSAMEGMLAPTFEEKVVCNVEIREVFRISKVGSVAGCMVLDGKITRNTKVRIIRDGIVIYTGELGSLKRFKDDVKEVATGYECGLNINGFNDIKEGDIIEGFEMVEVKK